MKMYRSILATALGLSSVGAMAATDGTLELGSTGSEGDFVINLDIPALVLITGLEDIELGDFSPGSDSNDTNTFCVYSNQATADVDIVVDFQDGSANTGAAPALVSATTSDEIPYQLDLTGTGGTKLDDIAYNGGSGATASSMGSADGVATSLSGSPGSYTCTESFGFDVTVLQADAGAVTAADDYTDEITVLVTAN